MDNRLKHALGERPNSEFVIDPLGKLVRKRAWSNPTELRKDLEELVGHVDKITLPEELKLKVEPPLAHSAAKGDIASVSRAGLFPIVTKPQLENGGDLFYAKLRSEADPALLDEGKGKLYLGFHLDPFHQAHWNNLQKPLRFELDAPEGVKLSATTRESPKANSETDSAPREFLLDVESWPHDKTIRLTVTYAACTEDVCHTVQQVYVLSRQRDKDAGRAKSAGFRVLTPDETVKRLMAGDKNGDGKLTKEELNSIQQPRFEGYDVNKDGILDMTEIQKMAQQQSASTESKD
ncbi:MAG: hypothetical protein IAF94_03845 [Pirellulaceae bacterium]|nr:hypothetical protein [Pirellulaceae bacterium]